jgi:hypothetical protein
VAFFYTCPDEVPTARLRPSRNFIEVIEQVLRLVSARNESKLQLSTPTFFGEARGSQHSTMPSVLPQVKSS